MGLALGYEDLNDHDELAKDQMLAIAVGKSDPTGMDRKSGLNKGKPLAGKSTLNRLELTPADATADSPYKKIVMLPEVADNLFIDIFLESYDKASAQIILDVDVTDDPLHGNQEGRFFHGSYKAHCYLPLYIFCGEQLLCARLRTASNDGTAGTIEKLERDGSPLRDYIYFNGRPFALMVYETSKAGLYYFINDHLGTPRRLVTSTSQPVWQAAYFPFGEAQVTVETVINNLRFPGQYFDVETGLHYNWHRFYDPETGRYISADPIGLDGGINLYAYVNGDPINEFDFKGLHKGDKWYGYNKKDFHKWFHRCWKEEGNPDAGKDEIKEAYEEWKRMGSPKGGKCGGPPPGEPAPENEPEQMCGDTCQKTLFFTGVTVVAVCCALQPEVCLALAAGSGTLVFE